MTTNPLRVARGTTATLGTRALKEGELAYNTDTEELHVGDGTTLGGRPVSSEVDGDDIDVTATGSTTARSLEDRFAERYSVADFGVVMDSAADQSALMQEALNAAAGNALFIPEGTIYCKELKVPDDTAIFGVEMDRSILKLPTSANTYILASASYVENSASTSLLGEIREITLDGNKANQATAKPLLIDRGFNSLRHRVKFKDSKGRGVLLTALSANSTAVNNGMANNNYTDCFFSGNVQEDFYGEDVTSGDPQLSDINISWCEFGGGNGGGGTPVYSIDIERAAGSKICNNQIYGEGVGQARLLKAGRLVFSGNHIDMTAQTNTGSGAAYGVYLGLGGHAHAALSGNVFHTDLASAGAPAWQLLYITSAEADARCALSGNTFYSEDFALTAWAHANSGHTVPSGNAYYNCSEPAESATVNKGGGWQRLAISTGAAVSHTGDTNETTLATIVLPAGRLGPNGVLRIRTLWSMSGTNTKTPRVKLGATAFLSAAHTTSTVASTETTVRNQNSQSAQVAYVAGLANPYGSSTSGKSTGAIDTSSAQNITFTAQLTNSGESITLESYEIETMYVA